MKKLTKAALIARICEAAPEYKATAATKALKRLRVADLSKRLAMLERKARKVPKCTKAKPAERESVNPAPPQSVIEMIPVAIFAPPLTVQGPPVDPGVDAKVDTRTPLLAGCFAAVYILIRSTVLAAFMRQTS